MSYSNITTSRINFLQFPFWQFIGGTIAILLFQLSIFSQAPNITTTDDQQTLIIDGNSDTQVYSFGKNVIVKQSAKEVFVFGGNVTIEGKVDGDVGTIGGSVIQTESAFIGGDVIVLGGTYQHEAQKPLRSADKETVIIGIFEEELRAFAQGKVLAIGISGFLLTTIGIMLSVAFLPGYISGLVSLMTLFLLFFAYVFGRVALQVSFGKLLQKYLLPESKHSETLAILLGVIAWTVILSIPYIWTFALLLLFSVSIGLVFTARTKNGWQKV